MSALEGTGAALRCPWSAASLVRSGGLEALPLETQEQSSTGKGARTGAAPQQVSKGTSKGMSKGAREKRCGSDRGGRRRSRAAAFKPKHSAAGVKASARGPAIAHRSRPNSATPN